MATLALAVVGCVLASGCGQVAVAESPQPPAGLSPLTAEAIVPYADIHAVLDPETGSVRTTLTDQSVDSPELMTLLLRVVAISTDECMVRQGFDAVASRIDWTPWHRENQLFGRWSESLAAAHGRDPAPSKWAPGSRTVAFGVAYNHALPECQEKARERYADDIAYLRADHIDVAIFEAARASVLVDPVAQATLGARDACLAAAGVVTDPDTRFVTHRYRDRPREEQVEVMVAATRCQNETGAIQVLFDLQSRYEAAYIDAYGDEMARHRTRLDEIAQRLSDELERDS